MHDNLNKNVTLPAINIHEIKVMINVTWMLKTLMDFSQKLCNTLFLGPSLDLLESIGFTMSCICEFRPKQRALDTCGHVEEKKGK